MAEPSFFFLVYTSIGNFFRDCFACIAAIPDQLSCESCMICCNSICTCVGDVVGTGCDTFCAVCENCLLCGDCLNCC